jgi:hypothetical protein
VQHGGNYSNVLIVAGSTRATEFLLLHYEACIRRTDPRLFGCWLAALLVQITAAEAGKTFALEWRMEATAHVASLMVRDQQCKVSV